MNPGLSDRCTHRRERFAAQLTSACVLYMCVLYIHPEHAALMTASVYVRIPKGAAIRVHASMCAARAIKQQARGYSELSVRNAVSQRRVAYYELHPSRCRVAALPPDCSL